MTHATDTIVGFYGVGSTQCKNCQLLSDQVDALRQVMAKDQIHYSEQLVVCIENSVKTLKAATDKIYELEKKLEEKT